MQISKQKVFWCLKHATPEPLSFLFLWSEGRWSFATVYIQFIGWGLSFKQLCFGYSQWDDWDKKHSKYVAYRVHKDPDIIQINGDDYFDNGDVVDYDAAAPDDDDEDDDDEDDDDGDYGNDDSDHNGGDADDNEDEDDDDDDDVDKGSDCTNIDDDGNDDDGDADADGGDGDDDDDDDDDDDNDDDDDAADDDGNQICNDNDGDDDDVDCDGYRKCNDYDGDDDDDDGDDGRDNDTNSCSDIEWLDVYAPPHSPAKEVSKIKRNPTETMVNYGELLLFIFSFGVLKISKFLVLAGLPLMEISFLSWLVYHWWR